MCLNCGVDLEGVLVKAEEIDKNSQYIFILIIMLRNFIRFLLQDVLSVSFKLFWGRREGGVVRSPNFIASSIKQTLLSEKNSLLLVFERGATNCLCIRKQYSW